MARLLLALLLLLPTTALAVDGFDKLQYGMTPDQVREAYPGQIKHDKEPKGAPKDTIGGRLVLAGSSRLFDEPVEVSAFFNGNGLSVIRLQFKKPQKANLDKVIEFYTPHWGPPIKTTSKLSATKKKRMWTWPWEGVELRAVTDNGDTKYQRIDFSETVRSQWTTADAAICSVLPGSSSCPFPDRFCPQQDGGTASGRRTRDFTIGETTAEIRCDYNDFALQDFKLVVEKPDPTAADWLERVLMRRLGEGAVSVREGGNDVLTDTRWDQHGVSLRVVRKAKVKTKTGWTGPVQYLRVKRDTKPPGQP
jgi:hypothetical protein